MSGFHVSYDSSYMKESKSDENENRKPSEKDDFYMENGLMVFTKAFHLNRGYCCQSGCRHCPYGFDESKNKNDEKDKNF